MELITAEKLKETIRATTGGFAYFPDDGKAYETPEGWQLQCGPYVLRSARIRAPRHFRTIDALINIARDCGISQVEVFTDPRSPNGKVIDTAQLDAFDGEEIYKLIKVDEV